MNSYSLTNRADKENLIYFLDDDLIYLKIVSHELKKQGYKNVRSFSTAKDIIEAVMEKNPDITILDYHLGAKKTGLDVLKKIKEISPESVNILLTASDDINVAIATMKNGAFDYVIKGDTALIKINLLLGNICSHLRTEKKNKTILRSKHLIDLDNETIKKLNVELEQSKANTEKSEERFRMVTESVGELIWEVDAKGVYTYISRLSESILGYKPIEIIGKKSFYDFFAPEIKEKSKNAAFEIFAKKEAFRKFENPNIHRDGHILILETSGFPILNDNGNLIGYRGADIDITERKQAEQELIKAKEKADRNIEMVLNSQSLAHICSYSTNLMETDIEKSSWICSPEFYKIFGIDKTYPHTIAGWAGFIHPDFRDELVAYHESVIKNRTSFNHEYKIIRINDGIERWVKGTGELVYDEQGNPVRMHGAIQDITELKKTEDELINAKEKAEESDRLKSAFVSNMSHEMRTPMNGILGFIGLLNEPDLSKDEIDEYTAVITRSGDRLLTTIHDIIDISRIDSNEVVVSKEETSINNLMDELYFFFSPEVEQKGLSLILKATTEQLTISTDRHKLHGILTNLIKNAIKYTEQGSITFGYILKNNTKFNEQGGITEVEFFVEDTGIGVPKDRTQAIFHRFEQADIGNAREFEGTGLGLAISKAYVEMIGGKIWVESKEGKGSNFKFTLPLEN